jgi:hypothetical protein
MRARARRDGSPQPLRSALGNDLHLVLLAALRVWHGPFAELQGGHGILRRQSLGCFGLPHMDALDV